MILGDRCAEFVVSYASIDERIVIGQGVVEKPKSAMREVQADGPNSRLFGRKEIEPKAPLGGSSPVQIGPLWPDLLLMIGLEEAFCS